MEIAGGATSKEKAEPDEGLTQKQARRTLDSLSTNVRTYIGLPAVSFVFDLPASRSRVLLVRFPFVWFMSFCINRTISLGTVHNIYAILTHIPLA